MAKKTKITNQRFNHIYNYMMSVWEAKQNFTKVNAVRDKLVAETNKLLREMFPEADMVVMRKYEMTRKDACLLFTLDGAEFNLNFDDTEAFGHNRKEELVDIPGARGCWSRECFLASKKLRGLYDELELLNNQYEEKRKEKRKEVRSFIYAFAYVEDLLEVVQVPNEVKANVFPDAGQALITASPEMIAKYKKEYGKIPESIEASV